MSALNYLHWFRQLIAHPMWGYYNWRASIHYRYSTITGKGLKHIGEYGRYLCPMEEALVRVTQQPQTVIRLTLESVSAQVQQPDHVPDRSTIPVNFNASLELGHLCYTICRLMRPSKVVEVGVANGQTSMYILKALVENAGVGRLYSIDLPYYSPGAERHIGHLVPRSFTSRWTLNLGPSQRLLPRLLPQIAPVDVFIHDGDHTYWTQVAEFRQAWSVIRPGGILVADDVVTDAFMELADESGVTPVVVAQSNKPEFIGILTKPTYA